MPLRFASMTIVCALLLPHAGAYAQKTKQGARSGVKPPSGANRFVTVVEFQRARRAPGANVSIEGYVLLSEATGSRSARLCLVDSTDKVLSAQEARKAAGTSVRCTVPLGAKQRPGWAMTARGLHKLSMYTVKGKQCVAVNDSPVKVRIQGTVGKDRVSLANVTKIEHHDDFGEWRELK